MSVAGALLKWAGGKRQLLSHLRPYYPTAFGSYLEPFLGSAAVFFDLHARGALEGHTVRLGDRSTDLMGTYTAVRDNVEEVITELALLQVGHDDGGERHYYEVRDTRFNPLRRTLPADAPYSPALAAMFIYLNRAGYNGLFRVNASGDFNVPAGRYARPRVCNAPVLRAASAALRGPGVWLARASFAETLKPAVAGDFVYLDPPYVPASKTASFTAYTAAGFDTNQQQALRALVVELADRGVQVLLSNSATAEVRALYDEPDARRAGLRTHLVPARRAINSRAASRGPVLEYLITNVQC